MYSGSCRIFYHQQYQDHYYGPMFLLLLSIRYLGYYTKSYRQLGRSDKGLLFKRAGCLEIGSTLDSGCTLPAARPFSLACDGILIHPVSRDLICNQRGSSCRKLWALASQKCRALAENTYCEEYGRTVLYEEGLKFQLEGRAVDKYPCVYVFIYIYISLFF